MSFADIGLDYFEHATTRETSAEKSRRWSTIQRVGCCVFSCSALALAIATSGGPLLLSTSTAALASDREDAFEDAKRMQEQAREMQKQAEEQRREAAKAAKRMEQEARKLQKEAEERQKEAARQAREAEEQRKAAAASRQSGSSSKASSSSSGPTPSSTSSSKTESASKKSSDDSSDDDDTSKTTSDKSGDKNKNAEKKDDLKDKQNAAELDLDEGPPATVEKWLQKLVAPSKPATPVAPAPPKTGEQTKTAVGTTGTDQTNGKTSLAKPQAAKAASGGRPDAIVFPEFASEVLAVNATRQTLEKAKALGFKSSAATSLANLDFAVTRLRAPQGMSSQGCQRRCSPAPCRNRISHSIRNTASTKRPAVRVGHPAGKTQPAGARAAQTGSCRAIVRR